MTIRQFREYLAFYEKNQLLREKFVISQKIDFGLLDAKLIFDFDNQLFCLSKKPDKTIFQGKELISFIIMEDGKLLFEGSAKGIRRYQSMVPEKITALAPQICQVQDNGQMADIPEPFENFNVELYFEHPYWHTYCFDISGPVFYNDCPDIKDYMEEYQREVEKLETLVYALKTVAFPDAPEVDMANKNAVMS